MTDPQADEDEMIPPMLSALYESHKLLNERRREKGERKG